MIPITMLLLAAQPITMVRLPGGEKVSADDTSPEATVALTGAAMAGTAGMIPDSEKKGLEPAMAKAYLELKEERGHFPSPIFREESAGGFDVLVVPAIGTERKDAAAVFLHGYGGSWTLECWLFARSVAPLGVTTVCPAVSTDGAWWNANGQKTLDLTVAWLHKQGRTHLVLAGLSNGGVGASELSVTREKTFQGVVCISGATGSGPEHLPVLVLHGKQDHMFGVEHAEAFASEAPHAQLQLYESNHFMLLHQRDPAAKRIQKWLADIHFVEPSAIPG